jgi:trehalose synthase-fused probable maltokinase
MTGIADALESIDLDALTDWVTGQRWFSAKSREVHVEVRTTVPICDDPGVGLLIAEARTPAGTHELFQLVVGMVDGRLDFDVLDQADRAAALADLLRQGGTAGDGDHTVSFRWADGAPAIGDPPAVRSLKAEQSNSSVVIDDTVILKVFRHLEPGENPELEMLEFLSSHGFENAPSLVGSYSLHGDLIDATLGVAQEFLGTAVDGWDMVQAALRDATTDDIAVRLVALGEVVGEMHSALGSDASDPDFAPEEATDEALPIFMATVDEEIEQVFSKLPEHEVFAPILGRGDDLRDRLRRMSQGGSIGRLIRHHGDLHLGQTMWEQSETRWTILDFEGEPSRPLRERRRKRSPLRDVAGMLRSFAYAASAAERAGTTLPDGWELSARSAFLQGYRSSVEPSLLPAGEAAFTQVLAIFELEKAVYELRYEIDNRPDWAAIPVAGIARLLDTEDLA